MWNNSHFHSSNMHKYAILYSQGLGVYHLALGLFGWMNYSKWVMCFYGKLLFINKAACVSNRQPPCFLREGERIRDMPPWERDWERDVFARVYACMYMCLCYVSWIKHSVLRCDNDDVRTEVVSKLTILVSGRLVYGYKKENQITIRQHSVEFPVTKKLHATFEEC